MEELKDKIIIRNYTDLSDFEVLTSVLMVVKGGKCSNTKQGEQYCFFTTFKSGLKISTSRKNDTYTFYVYK